MGTFLKSAILPEGVYGFRTIEAVKRMSRAGNLMWELHHRVDARDGYNIIVGFLTIAKESQFVIRNFFHSIGCPDKAESENWKRADFIFQEGLLMCRQDIHRGRSINVIYDYALGD